MSVVAILLVATAGAGVVRIKKAAEEKASTLNYQIDYEKPSVHWKAMPHGPQTLFLFQNTASHVLLRGAVNQVVADYNPTPELDTDHIAEFYIDRTHENMPDWSAEELGKVAARGTNFRLIKRGRKDKEVVTAYAVKGNTTLLVSISGEGKQKGNVELAMPEFQDFLAHFKLTQKDMSDL